MQDRVPIYPGRVTLTPVSGQENTFDMVRADEPYQGGTPLNKETLLTDETAAAIGAMLGADAPDTPDGALNALCNAIEDLINSKIQIETGTYVGDGTSGSSNKNVLNFSFEPKLVIIQGKSFVNSSSEYPMLGVYVWGNYYMWVVGASSTSVGGGGQVVASTSENKLSWYAKSTSSAAQYQLNYSNVTYQYFAIG